MTTLSITLPETLAKASQEAARKLGVSRTQFIRQAIVHEVEGFQSRLEQEAMIKSIIAMKNDKSYLEETEEIDESLISDLPKERKGWWNKKKS